MGVFILALVWIAMSRQAARSGPFLKLSALEVYGPVGVGVAGVVEYHSRGEAITAWHTRKERTDRRREASRRDGGTVTAVCMVFIS